MAMSKKSRKGGLVVNNAVVFILVVVSVSCLLVLVMSVLKLPEVPRFYKGLRKVNQEEEKLGKLGEMMVGMLPDDLAFTLFVPSEKAFWRDLRLKANDSLVEQNEVDNTYATITRILGFSAVPRSLLSVDVPLLKDITFDSISGFSVHVSREPDGSMLVNRVHSQRVDLRKGDIVIHIMNGVIMDAEFEQSVRPDYDDEH